MNPVLSPLTPADMKAIRSVLRYGDGPDEASRKVVIVRRSDGYRASLEGCPGVWGGGLSPLEAIGTLVFGFQEKFGVSIPALDPEGGAS